MCQAVTICILVIWYISLLLFKETGMENLHFGYPAYIVTDNRSAEYLRLTVWLPGPAYVVTDI